MLKLGMDAKCMNLGVSFETRALRNATQESMINKPLKAQPGLDVSVRKYPSRTIDIVADQRRTSSEN